MDYRITDYKILRQYQYAYSFCSGYTFLICTSAVIADKEYTWYSDYRKDINDDRHTDNILSDGKIPYGRD